MLDCMDNRLTAFIRSLDDLSQWNCRLCGFGRYHRVAVLRKTGARYGTGFAQLRRLCYRGRAQS